MRIFKYTLEKTDKQKLLLPLGARILSVQVQYNSPQLWALVNEKEKFTREVTISTYGTGNPIPVKDAEDMGTYLGTYQVFDGDYVFHVFYSGI